MIRTERLDNGLTVLIEPMHGVRSCGCAWLLPGGSASDPVDKQGRAAMWSEIMCRGAGELDSRAHADALDRAGASRHTDSGSRFLSLSSAMLGEKFAEVFPLLADMVVRPLFAPDAVDPARELSLQALESLKDDPQERAVLAARERHHPEPLNRSGYGDEAGLNALSHEELFASWKGTVQPGGSILSIAGAVDADAVLGEIARATAGWTGEGEIPDPGGASPRGYGHETDDTNQVQVVVVHEGPTALDDASVLERVAAAVLSGGMSGRLFTEVREKRGLCYAVSASYRASREFGATTAYVGTTPERAQESLEVLFAELERIRTPEGAITQEEFDRAMVGLKSGLVFGGESTSARASALANDMFVFGRGRTLEERAEELASVTLEAVNDYLAGSSLGGVTIQTVGPEALRVPEAAGAGGA